MRRERCPTCGRAVFVKRGVAAEVLQVVAAVLVLVAAWVVVSHVEVMEQVVRELR